MQDRIVEFANVLRRNGVRVSLSENIDALRALDLLGIGNLSIFRDTLRTTLVKHSSDLKSFEELFDFFFLGLGRELEESDRRITERLGLTPLQLQEMRDQIEKFFKQTEGNFSELTRALLTGNTADIEKLLRAAIDRESRHAQENFWFNPYTRMTRQLELDRVQNEVQRFRDLLRLLAKNGEDVRNILAYLGERLKELNRVLRELVRQEQRKQGLELAERTRATPLAEKSFAFYTEDDIRRMNEVVARLAQRLKNRLSVRRKKASKGRFDVKDTLRKNLQFGGVPFRIHLARRKKQKPEVMVWCDISDSVLNASRFMLQFVYSIQDLYSKVRSFVFVSDIGEVTRLFEENEIHQAIETALRGDIIDVYSHSNFGRAFEFFYRGFLLAVNSRTTLLIIGDGRNNYNRANEWVLREFQQKAKQIIWLNPESRLTWGVGDSEMLRYAPYCDVVEECRNINQLHKVIDLIAP
jgi:uncharacterized protein with von Willebrand factor type A (vWA) domain